MKKESYKLYRKFWDKDGSAKRCFLCISPQVKTEVISMLDYTVCEYREVCMKCKSVLSYWAYGGYDGPPPSDEDIVEMRNKRKQC